MCRLTTYIVGGFMNVQDQQPLFESTFLIILSLVPSPKHGYAIMKEVEALSDVRVVLSTGTLTIG